MLTVKRLIVGQLATNCYLIYDRASGEAIIIDPGDDGDYIIRVLADLEVKPVKIVATHGHFDHILAANELKLAYQIPFLIHREDEFLLKRMGDSASHFLGLATDPAPKTDTYLEEGDSIKVGSLSLKVLATPGHTPGSISLYSKKLGIIFVGDVIFAEGGVGRTDFKYASAKDLEKSIKKLLKLPKDTLIYPGHGEETTIQESRLSLL